MIQRRIVVTQLHQISESQISTYTVQDKATFPKPFTACFVASSGLAKNLFNSHKWLSGEMHHYYIEKQRPHGNVPPVDRSYKHHGVFCLKKQNWTSAEAQCPRSGMGQREVLVPEALIAGLPGM